MRPHPTDTQYAFPSQDSPFIIMRYGDGWGIYNKSIDQMILLSTGDHPVEVKSPETCEGIIRMLLFARKKTKVM